MLPVLHTCHQVKKGRRYRLRIIQASSSWGARIAVGGGHLLRVIMVSSLILNCTADSLLSHLELLPEVL